MKKFLAVFVLGSVLLASGLAGLSVLPHSHGNDFDHSQHKSCPVYQFGLGHAAALAIAAVFTCSLFMVRRLFLPEARFSTQRYFRFHPLRAPPIAS